MNRLPASIAKAIAAVAVAAVAAAAGLAQADTQNLTLSAVVSAQCKFTSAATTMDFGSVDPSSAGPIAGVLGTSVTYKCTKGVTPGTATASAGANASKLKDTVSGDLIPYTLTVGLPPTGTGFGTGMDQTLPVTASLAATDYQNASAGTYSDTVVLTVSP